MGVNHGHWNRKPRKGGPRIYVFFGVSRDSSIDGKLFFDHIDRAPIDAPQQGVFRCGSPWTTKVSVMIDLDKF